MKKVVRIVECVVLYLLLCSGYATATGSMNDYCVTPAFIQTPVPSNLLLLFDNSASQYDLLYTGTTDCYDSSYNSSTAYLGYFPYPVDSSGNKNGDYIYQYDMTNNKFVLATAFPTTTTDTYNTSYLYIHMTGTGASRYVDAFYAKGNFLNWLIMSKLDVQKKVLTGGKWISGASPYLLAQSRGCNGMRFIKSIPESDWLHNLTATITLANGSTATVTTLNIAVRGPQASENYDPANPNNMISPSTLGGQTKVEIYEAAYNYSQCQNAITAWQQQILGNGVGNVWTDVQACLGTSGTGNTAAGRENANYVEWVRDCVQIAQNIKNGLTTFDTSSSGGSYSNGILKGVTPNNFAGNCEAVYTANTTTGGGCGVPSNTSNGDTTQRATNQTAIESCTPLNNTLGGNYSCSRKTNLITTSAQVPAPYNVLDSLAPNASVVNDGFAGSCWNGQTQGGNAESHFTPSDDPYCLGRQILHFCASTAASNVIDPSSGAADSPSSGNLPAILVEAGLRSGGTPMHYGSASGSTTMLANVDMNSQPMDGVIQRYQNKIRLGVMTFNFDGSASECYDPVTNTGPASSQIICGRYCKNTTTPANSSQKACKADADCLTGETCTLLPKTDASMIPANAYIGDPIGDHSSGIVQAIDNINATSWTPFAEAMYNAIGYYAKDSSGNSRWRLQTGDFSLTRNPQQFLCQANNVLLITDGMSTADQNSTVNNVATWAQAASGLNAGQTGYDSTNACPTYSGSRNFDDLVWLAKNRNINAVDISSAAALATSPVSGTSSSHKSEYINTYILFTGSDQPNMPGQCNPTNLLTAAATNGGTTLIQANPLDIQTKLDSAFAQIAGNASSGTAASILSNSEGSGANILQAVFFPSKIFDGSSSVNWIGEMQNLWYYVDPYINNSTIREDTDSDLKLNLINDYVIKFYFDNSSNQTLAQRYSDSNGDAITTASDAVGGPINPDYIKSIWRAGMGLFLRDDSGSTARTIYTGYNSTSGSTPQLFTNGNLNTTSSTSTWDALQIPSGGTITNTQRQTLATNLINYIRGTDQTDDTAAPCLNSDCKYRNRKVTLRVCSNNQQRCQTAADCPTGGTCSSPITKEWKLGDIISATPRVQSTVRLNSYNLSAPTGYSDKSYESFINSNNYKGNGTSAHPGNGMVYVGVNDGMLHAFKLGTLSVAASGSTKATLSGTGLGTEQWAYIPSNTLPYLKHLSDNAYSHLYYVDGRTVVLDASIGDHNSGTCVKSTYWQCDKLMNNPVVDSSNNLDTSVNTWRTVVISGMGLGGASRDATDSSCTTGKTGTCVKTPTTGNGFSSYSALDVTDPNNPTFLWEFSHPLLGYATTAPAIVRIGDKNKNGRWFAVFGNGPFGPIDTDNHQFLGTSTHHLRFFVVDLNATPPFVQNSNYWILTATGINNAFAGTMLGGSIDADRRDQTVSGNYQDDAVYAGYVQKGSDGYWSDGGVVRIMTNENQNHDHPNDPSQWTVSSVIDGIGPVTTAIARTQDTRFKNLWLYFGTGRYFYRNTTTIDDNDNTRSLFGIQEPCYNTATKQGNFLDGTCTTTVLADSLVNQTNSISMLGSSDKGWRIDLDAKTSSTGAERVVTDTVALTNGTVFFTSFKPTLDVCGYGGNSYLWGVNYSTGDKGAANALQGKVLIQLSTGEFKEVDLSTAFTDKGNRRMATPMTGKPPSDAPPIISSSLNRPIKKILHIKER